MTPVTNCPWRTDDPPKDGTMIVALGNITDQFGDGTANVEPFTDSIQWDGNEWVNSFGLSMRMLDCSEVTILHWRPTPN